MDADFTVEEVVQTLGLTPLGDGEWGRVMGTAEATAGSLVSAYRLLTNETSGDWRAVKAEELWTAYMGAGLEVELATDGGLRRETVEAGSGVWMVAPPGGWLRTRPLGVWCLAGRIGPEPIDHLTV